MTAKDLLGLIVRLFGLMMIVVAAYLGMFALSSVTGLVPQAQNPVSRYAIYSVVYALFGFAILFGAQRIENFCYRHKR